MLNKITRVEWQQFVIEYEASNEERGNWCQKRGIPKTRFDYWFSRLNSSRSKMNSNKVFDDGTIDGLVVAGIDRTQTFNSDKKNCEHCLKAFKKGKVEQRNFHSSVVISTIGQGPKTVVDFEPYRTNIDKAKKDEGELTVAKRLIKRVSKNYGTL